MHSTTNQLDVASEVELPEELQKLKERIHHAAQLLPAQGPIGVFIHHNTLHAFEHQNFDQAVRTGSRVFGCQPYLSEDRYREELARGRIQFSELSTVLKRDLGVRASEMVQGLSTRLDLRLAMLQHPLRSGSRVELEWFIAETDALRKARRDVSEVQRRQIITETRHWVMRRLRGELQDSNRPLWIDGLFTRFRETRIEEWSDSRWEEFTLTCLWEVCSRGVQLAGERQLDTKSVIRHRDVLYAIGGIDSDLLVNDVLIRFCAAFLDQGIGQWNLPERDRGLFQAFCSTYRGGGAVVAWWLTGLGKELDRLQRNSTCSLASIQESLNELGVQAEDTSDFTSATLLALRGWAGMIWHVEGRPDRVHHPVAPGSLVDFLAVRLLLDVMALRASARISLGYDVKLTTMRAELLPQLPSTRSDCQMQQAFLVFQLAQILGWSPEQLYLLRSNAWTELLDELENFGELDRRRVFHLAYEHRVRVQALDALSSRSDRVSDFKERPSFQAVFCIDEREESIRRHLEEISPTVETFGVAGFFGVVMYYRSASAADFVPLCPVVVRPKHWVSEAVEDRLLAEHQRRRNTRRRVGMTLQAFHTGSRRIVSGSILAATIGLLATIPLVTRVMFPRMTARFRGFFGSMISPPPKTRLILERSSLEPSSDDEGLGFLPEEMAQIAERLLRDMGLTSGMSRLVFLIGHGSTSMNNPHESAHDCGACGGGVGGPNARAAAQMLNDPRVRAALRGRGIQIPADSVFIGGLHNTSKDSVLFWDCELLPDTHRFEFEAARLAINEASARNAHERARRFDSASLVLTPSAAKRHMEGRAEDLSQVRPEWGHATNAICVVGRRQLTRGLFLDRRAFLVSYDPGQDDPASAILERILSAVVPVCSGINLEYYFSYVDSPGWGSGSKLPHNITGLVGVMDGAMSDLRTGLPWQMVEIHEPVRLLFVIEATTEVLLSIIARNQAVNSMVVHQWIQLAVIDPQSSQVSTYHDGAFETYVSNGGALPVSVSSKDWYSGWREPLEFAEIHDGRRTSASTN